MAQVCKNCKKEFPLTSEHWYKQRQGSALFSLTCKTCALEQQHAYYLAHSEKIKAKTKNHRLANLEQYKAKEREYSAAHREENAARSKAWRTAHAEEIKAKKAARRDEIRAYNAAHYAAHREELRARAKAWREAHPDRSAAALRRYREANLEKTKAALKATYQRKIEERRAYGRAYYWAHRQQCLERAKRARAADPEKTREYYRAQYHAKDPEKRRDEQRQWRSTHRAVVLAWKRDRYARRRGAPGTYTLKDIENMYASQNGRCFYCAVELRERFDVDHYIPISKGGSNWPENLRIACKRCNSSKRDRMPDEFRKRRGPFALEL